MAWHQLSVISNETTAPQLADYFSELGAVSVTYMDAEDQPVYEPALGETKIWTQTRVIALFEMEYDPVVVKSRVCSQFSGSLLRHWVIEILADQIWERQWLKHFHPVKFADKLWVCPGGQEKYEIGTVCMTLDPGLAFGTGSHPTTALCLEWLAAHELQDKIVIDYGCGSGILAMAALLLGAKQVYCVDIDPQALEATQCNAKKNGVHQGIQCYLPEQLPLFQADIVLANILAKPLIELCEPISSRVKPQGLLILSGILNEQAERVMEAYRQQGLCYSDPVSEDGWCRLDGNKSC